MTAARRIAHQIYLAARNLPDAERRAFVDKKCGKNQDLRREVEVIFASLLESPAVPSSILPPDPDSEGASHAPSTTTAASYYERLEKLAEQSNSASRYRIQKEIGRGGQGAILRVFDNDLRRTLAMKVVLNRGDQLGSVGSARSSGVLARFLEEAQVTGQLDHPGVVPVHELGVDEEGRAYFTMRLVKGRELRHIIAAVHRGDPDWTLTRALGVLLKVCEAMAYAHDKGVVHRDLKPANIMVGKYGEVYVMDWGLARVAGREDPHEVVPRPSVELSLSLIETDRQQAQQDSTGSAHQTLDGSVVGTPQYMSPEQAAGLLDEVDARSDVYAVGAMLYQLITGQAPYHEPGRNQRPHEVLQAVQAGPPTALRRLADGTPPELEAICERAMARDRARRYEDMGALSRDLQAYLEGRVVQAYRSGALTEFRKWVGRNRGTASSLAAAVLILLAGLVSSSVLYVDARDSGARAIRQSYVAGILAADISVQRGRILEARSYLDGCDPELRNWEWAFLKQRTDSGLTDPADLGSSVTALVYTPDHRQVLVGTEDGRVGLRHATSGAESLTFAGRHDGPVVAVAISADGREAFSLDAGDERVLTVWDATTGRRKRALPLEVDPRCATIRPDLGRLAVGTVANEVHVWALDESLTPEAVLSGHTGSVLSVVFLGDGGRLLSASEDRTVRAWDIDEGRTENVWPTPSAAHSVVVDPAGLEFAVGLESGKIQRWALADGRPLSGLGGNHGLVFDLAYSPDGSRLATCSLDRSVRVWDVQGQTLLTTLWGHDDAARCLAFRGDGQHLVTGSTDRSLRLWSSHSDGAVESWVPSDQESVSACRFDVTGPHLLVATSWNANLEQVDLESGERTWRRPGEEDAITALDQSPDGDALAIAYEESWTVVVSEHPSGRELGRHEFDAAVLDLAFAADGESLVVALDDGQLLAWAPGGEPSEPWGGHGGPVRAVERIADGSGYLSASDDGTIRRWVVGDEASGQVLVDVGQPVHSLAVDPTGRWIGYGHGERGVELFDLETSAAAGLHTGHERPVRAMAFSPDGRRLVTGSDDRTLGVWHVEDGRQLLMLRGHMAPVSSVAVSPDGDRLASTSMDGTVRVWVGGTDDEGVSPSR